MITLMDKHAIIKLKKEGLSNRSIEKQIGIDRKTVAKYWKQYCDEQEKLSSQNIDLKVVQERITSKPKYDASNRKPSKYSYEIDQALEEILISEKAKAKLLGNNKQHLTNVQIHEELIKQGFDIGKTTISNKIKEKRNRNKECFIRQSYGLGDRLEFDFGEVKLQVGEAMRKYYMAVFSSPAADFRWMYLYNNQSKAVFMDAHVRFFEMMGGVYNEVVYDNMKNVVKRFIGRHEKELNDDLVKMSLYYGFRINVTNCFSGNEKGHVEGSVKYLRNKIFAPRYVFSSYEAVAIYMEKSLIELNKGSSISLEKKHLLPYKPKLELAEIRKLTVDKYSFVRIENNFYSVPDYLVGKSITGKIYYDSIDLYANDHLICSHKKRDGSKEISIDIRHYLKTFERKPGALHHSLALKSMPELKSIFDIHFKTKPKKFIEILKLNQKKSIDEITEIFKELVYHEVPVQENSQKVVCMTMNQLKLYDRLSIKEVRQ